MLFRKVNYSNSPNICDIRIFMNGESLQKVDCAKLLGVLIDDDLTWKPHIDSVSATIAQCTGILFEI